MTTTVPMKQWFGFFFFFYCSIVIPYIYIYPSTINASSSTKLLLLLLLSSLALHDASLLWLLSLLSSQHHRLLQRRPLYQVTTHPHNKHRQQHENKYDYLRHTSSTKWNTFYYQPLHFWARYASHTRKPQSAKAISTRLDPGAVHLAYSLLKVKPASGGFRTMIWRQTWCALSMWKRFIQQF